jgi:hypothetical protein
MPRTNRSTRTTKSIDDVIAAMDAPALRDLIHALAKHSAENRALIAARTGMAQPGRELLESSKKKITAQFFIGSKPRFSVHCDFALCRRLIKQYMVSTMSPDQPCGFDTRGFLELGLHYLMTCSRNIAQHSWDDPKPYDSMAAVADELIEFIALVPEHAEELLPTVRTINELGQEFGYGFCDVTGDLEVAFEAAAAQRP